jgi:hypothetical protein
MVRLIIGPSVSAQAILALDLERFKPARPGSAGAARGHRQDGHDLVVARRIVHSDPDRVKVAAHVRSGAPPQRLPATAMRP